MSTQLANILRPFMPLVAPSQPSRPGLVAYLSMAWRIRAERRALMELTERDLKDIGLSRSQVYREGSRGLFDLPIRGPRPYHFR